MGLSVWIAQHWFELVETIGIIGGLLFTAFTTRKDERARRISNLIAVTEQHRQIWMELYDRPRLSRILKKDVNLNKDIISEEEALFVNLLILHLGTVYRAMKEGVFVKLEGLQEDVKEFFALPIPKAIWEKAKSLQDKDFAEFIGKCCQAG
jgi:hypothetical protein